MSDAFKLEGNLNFSYKDVVDGLKKVDEQLKNTKKSTEEAENTSSSSSGKVSSVLKGLGGTIASTFTLNKVKDFTNECVQGANYQIQSETKLQNNLMATGKATMDNVQTLKEYASQMQKSGVIGDEVNMMGMAQLSTFNLSSEAIKKLDKGMLDLAVNQKGTKATGDDLMGYANLLGKAMQGNAGALTKVGVTMDEHQKKIIKEGSEMEKASTISDVLQANYGNLNEEIAKTPEGKMTQLNNDLGDLKEQVGLLVIPAIQKLVEWIQGIVNWFNSLSPAIQKIVLISGGVLAILPSIIGLLSSLSVLAGGLGISFGALLGPIILVIGVIASLIAIGVVLYKNWDSIKAKCSEIKEHIVAKWEEIKNSVGEKVESLKNSVKEKWQAMKDGISAIWNDVEYVFTHPIQAAKDFIGGAISDIKGFFNFEWHLPHLDLPHFNISGDFSLNPPSIPTFNVDWYSTGGIFTKPTVLGNTGVGDANNGQGNQAEAVMRYNDLMNIVEKALNRPIEAIFNVDGREFTRQVVAPNQDQLDSFNVGRY